MQSLMMEAVRTSETSVENQFTRQYNPEDNSEHHNAVTKQFSRSEDKFLKTLPVLFFRDAKQRHI
jgi:hydrogenase maturation factor